MFPSNWRSMRAFRYIDCIPLRMKSMSMTAAEDLLEIVMRRYERASTLLTSNRPVDDWGHFPVAGLAVTPEAFTSTNALDDKGRGGANLSPDCAKTVPMWVKNRSTNVVITNECIVILASSFPTQRCRVWFHLKHRTSHLLRIAEVSGLSPCRSNY